MEHFDERFNGFGGEKFARSLIFGCGIETDEIYWISLEIL
jgi:hypothetical protein